MILTVTLNPAVDVTYDVGRLRPGTTHRVTAVTERAGGKGLNVARVLHQLGRPVTVTGLVGGRTGGEIRAELAEAGITEAFVRLQEGASRRTVTVLDEAGATLLNEPGPRVSASEWERAQRTLVRLAGQSDLIVLSGSLPPGVPATAYADLSRLAGADRCLVDTSGAGLVAAAEAGVGLLTPNAEELIEATGLTDVVAAARAMLERGAGGVVVTLGEDGMLAVTLAGSWRARLPERLEGNPTGAGDAAAAALASGLAAGDPWPALLREAVAWSAAAVPVPYAGEVDLPTLARIRDLVVVDESEE